MEMHEFFIYCSALLGCSELLGCSSTASRAAPAICQSLLWSVSASCNLVLPLGMDATFIQIQSLSMLLTDIVAHHDDDDDVCVHCNIA